MHHYKFGQEYRPPVFPLKLKYDFNYKDKIMVCMVKDL